jgi:hypothetical protein
MKNFWFKAKNYGWGWHPATWQGWLITLGYVVVAVLVARGADSASPSASDTLYGVTLPLVVLTAALIAVCWKTGEKPEWRWGGKPLRKKRP